jgi:ABC-type dipeptide/oligopeptide/nickel transport system permease component
MARFIIRASYSIVTIFILSATIFLIVRLHGDPVVLMQASARPKTSTIRHRGLDRSWPVQYVTFMQNAFKGELGKSFNYRLPVTELYFQRLPNSLTLGLAATLISLLIGIPAGIISAVKVNTPWDNVAKGIALLGLSIPGFGLRLVLIPCSPSRLLAADVRGRRLAPRRHARPRARVVLRRVDAPADALEHAGGPAASTSSSRGSRGSPTSWSSPCTRSRTR